MTAPAAVRPGTTRATFRAGAPRARRPRPRRRDVLRRRPARGSRVHRAGHRGPGRRMDRHDRDHDRQRRLDRRADLGWQAADAAVHRLGVHLRVLRPGDHRAAADGRHARHDPGPRSRARLAHRRHDRRRHPRLRRRHRLREPPPRCPRPDLPRHRRASSGGAARRRARLHRVHGITRRHRCAPHGPRDPRRRALRGQPGPVDRCDRRALGIWPVVVGSQALLQWARARRNSGALARRRRTRARRPRWSPQRSC